MSALRLCCPLCAQPLTREPPTWRCTHGHGFDVAREGYVNLLPVQHKRSLSPGDTPESIRARRAFLDAGHYAPLREALAAQVAALQPRSVLDVGCGEGYYTQALADSTREVAGLDIAKPAVQLAARRRRGITWLVGSAAHLPFADASLDVLVSLFTPLHVAQMARVLPAGASLIVVTPGADHLHALRAALFEQVQPHVPEKFVAEVAPAFSLCERQDLRVDLHLDRAAVHALLAMTPYAWKARPERRNALEAREVLHTQAQFTLLRFVRG